MYRGREIARWDHHLNALVVRKCLTPPRTHQNYMNGFFKAFRVPVRVHKATESIEVYFGMERNGLISALEVGGDHFEAGLEYYRRETRPATEAEEKEAVTYLRQRNYIHFKLSKRCTLKR